MNKKLAPAFVELTQDALLKAFWFKPSMRLFLLQHHISESSLAQWHADQSKRDFIVWLWPRLIKDDSGQDAIMAMARSLAEMRHFPDLERKEDTKVRIPEAVQAINRLRIAVAAIDEMISDTKAAQKRRQAAEKQVEKLLNAQQSLEKFQSGLNALIPKIGTQDGGYEFEKWLYNIAIFFELDARTGYKASDCQIDGAMTIEGTTFLLEAKLVKEPVGSPEIDIFMAKIESKADNTMGLFVSFSGFNEIAKRAASKQRTPMLLLDSGHFLNIILRGIMTFPQVVCRIKRHAHQTGSSYLGSMDF